MRTVEVHVEGESIGALSPPFTMGRDPECDVILPDSSVSRRHVKVSASDSGFFVEDVGSSNGTWVDGRRISREIIPGGHPMVVGRVSVVMNYSRDTDPSGVKPVAKPESNTKESARKETLAVDIPQGYFDPRNDAPAMRMFECPGCSRRLRCASSTRRVKCRSCAAIIRFEGDIPKLEVEPEKKPAPQPKAPPVSPRPPAPEAPPAARPPSHKPASTPSPVARSERTTSQKKAPRTPVDTDLLTVLSTSKTGVVGLALIFGGGMLLLMSVLATMSGAGDLLPLAVLGTALFLGGCHISLFTWFNSTNGPDESPKSRSPKSRLQTLTALRDEGSISESEYQEARRSVLGEF